MSAASFLHSSFLQAVNAVMLWLVRAEKVPQASEHLCPAKLQTRCDICSALSTRANIWIYVIGLDCRYVRTFCEVNPCNILVTLYTNFSTKFFTSATLNYATDLYHSIYFSALDSGFKSQIQRKETCWYHFLAFFRLIRILDLFSIKYTIWFLFDQCVPRVQVFSRDHTQFGQIYV